MNIESANQATVTFLATNYAISGQDWTAGLSQLVDLVAHGDQDWQIEFGDQLALTFPVTGPVKLETSNVHNWPKPFEPEKRTIRGVPPNATWLGDAPSDMSYVDLVVKTVQATRSMIIFDLRGFASNEQLTKLMIELDGKKIHLWKTTEGMSFTLSR